MDPIADATTLLLTARREGRPVPAPTLPDAAAAYAVQARVADALGWFSGGVPRHWKTGGPSREAVPTHAPLPPAGVHASPADLRAAPWTQLRVVEAEVALRLGRDVDAATAATLDRDRAAALVDALCVAIELVDSRWTEALQAPALAKLADLQSHAALVLGAWQPWAPWAAHDWRLQPVAVTIGSAATKAFVGSHSMGDPAWVLPAWLRHATRDGAVVPAGTVVTTGTWCGMLPAAVGDRVQVHFDGLGEAQVQL